MRTSTVRRLTMVCSILAILLTACSSAAPAAPTAPPAAKAVPTQAAAPVAPIAPTPMLVAPTQAPATAATAVPQAARQPIGDLKIAVSNFYGEVLDPTLITETGATLLAGPMFDSLLGFSGADPKKTYEPEVAERWEMAADGLSWTLYIRKGIKFHDGSDLTAEDVKFSIDRYMAPKSVSSRAGIMRTSIESVDVKDPYTVVIKTKGVQTEILDFFTRGWAQEGYVMPKKYVEKVGDQGFKDKPIGSGPWKLADRKSGVSVTFEAVASHWLQAPDFKTLTYLLIPEENSRAAMLRKGDVDIAEISTPSVDELKKAGLKIHEVSGLSQSMVALTGTYVDQKAPTSNLKVRQALDLAINRQDIADNLFKGYASPGNSNYAFTASYWYDAKLFPAKAYDPNKAKALLKEAGYENGFDFRLYTFAMGGRPYMLDLAAPIASDFNKIGVKTQLVPTEWEVIRAKYMKSPLESDMIGAGMIIGGGLFPGSTGIGRMWTMPGSAVPLLGNTRADLLQKYEDLVGTKDAQQKLQKATKLAREVEDVEVSIPVVYHSTLFGYGPRVAQLVSPAGLSFNQTIHRNVKAAR